MSFTIGTFDDDHAALAAAQECRARGISIVDLYSPYPVHGADEVLGIRPNKLPFVCLIGGLLGLAGGLVLQYWTSAVNWPLNVGGMPFDSLPAFVPVAFETTILLAGLCTAFALIAASRLWPGKGAQRVRPRITDDRLALVLERTDASLRDGEIAELLQRHGALEVEEEP